MINFQLFWISRSWGRLRRLFMVIHIRIVYHLVLLDECLVFLENCFFDVNALSCDPVYSLRQQRRQMGEYLLHPFVNLTCEQNNENLIIVLQHNEHKHASRTDIDPSWTCAWLWPYFSPDYYYRYSHHGHSPDGEKFDQQRHNNSGLGRRGGRAVLRVLVFFEETYFPVLHFSSKKFLAKCIRCQQLRRWYEYITLHAPSRGRWMLSAVAVSAKYAELGRAEISDRKRCNLNMPFYDFMRSCKCEQSVLL